MADARAPIALWHSMRALWHSVRVLSEFRRLLELRVVSQFGDGLFAAGIVGAILFNPERAATPWAIAGSFAVLYLPYSLLGPFAGALLDRWDRRLVLVGANVGRVVMVLAVAALLAASAGDLAILCAALIVNGFTRFVSSGLSAALPHVVPREQVVTMNSVATATGMVAAFLGAIFMLLPRTLFGADDTGAATIILIVAVPVLGALWLSWRFPPHILGPDDSARAIHGSVGYAVATGWVHGIRTVATVPTVAATLAGLAAHRMVLGINSLLVLVIVRHTDKHEVAGFGTAALFAVSVGGGAFLAAVVMPAAAARWGRYATANGALAAAAVVQLARVRPGATDDDRVRIPARARRAGGQAVRGQRDATGRRRRAARPRVHGPGRAVLDVVHSRNHVGGERDSTRRPPTDAGARRRRGVPARPGGARRDRQARIGPGLG